MPPVQIVHARLTELALLAPEVFALVFTLEQDARLHFLAGQYARVEFVASNQERFVREYSIASTPSMMERNGRLVFHVRATPGGRFAELLDARALVVGDVVRIEGPYGNAHLRQLVDAPMLLIAGGTGLGPMLSIAETAIECGMRQSMRMYVGMRSERDVYGEATLQELASRHPGFQYTYVLSEPEGSTSRPVGFVTDFIANEFADVTHHRIYLAGPPAMTDAAARLLKARGAQDAAIHTDAFYAAPGPSEPGGKLAA
ncbi:MAG TPA: FAD-binding oxidoreductase [Burkholderiaceae bacterium]|nr:FAD-binding oxidoreductase [Burkholderiaceae bacterium]